MSLHPYYPPTTFSQLPVGVSFRSTPGSTSLWTKRNSRAAYLVERGAGRPRWFYFSQNDPVVALRDPAPEDLRFEVGDLVRLHPCSPHVGRLLTIIPHAKQIGKVVRRMDPGIYPYPYEAKFGGDIYTFLAKELRPVRIRHGVPAE